MKIVIASHSDQVRGPWLKFLLTSYLEGCGVPPEEFEIYSGGTNHGCDGNRMTESALRLLVGDYQEHLGRARDHVSRYVYHLEIREADYLIMIDDSVKSALEETFAGGIDDIASKMILGITDPYGLGEKVYQGTFNALVRALPRIAEFVTDGEVTQKTKKKEAQELVNA